jgi:hypothetical protein
VLRHRERERLREDVTLSIAWHKGRMNTMHHTCVYKYSSTRAILVPSERVIRARVAKTCQILGKVETPGTHRTGCGVSLTDVSPESSFVNGFSADLSLFDSLEIKYIIHWSIDKKLLRHEI